jgi:pimeloyl-ACP methyl ester carboxylesterase
MPYIQTTDKTTGEEINIHYQDWGTGPVAVFIHGWPVNLEMWEYQRTELAAKGIRCVAYDRRGFGKSEKPWSGYDYDTMTDDLKAVLDGLDLQDVTLVGFSMGGGEVVRYFSRHGGARVKKAVLVAAVTPYLLKTDDNPKGVPAEVFEGMAKAIAEDRPAFLKEFGKAFFGVNIIKKPVSAAILEQHWHLAMEGTLHATLECAKAFSQTDFRKDLPQVNVPTLIIHGDADKTVPIEPTAQEAVKAIPDAKLVVYEDAAHGLFITEKERLNKDLAEFILGA